eukprot:Sspe_Gene.49617::Locus_26911_Transcript_1_1_Confidence_1.000_Length_1652::g.49617::m.49617
MNPLPRWAAARATVHAGSQAVARAEGMVEAWNPSHVPHPRDVAMVLANLPVGKASQAVASKIFEKVGTSHPEAINLASFSPRCLVRLSSAAVSLQAAPSARIVHMLLLTLRGMEEDDVPLHLAVDLVRRLAVARFKADSLLDKVADKVTQVPCTPLHIALLAASFSQFKNANRQIFSAAASNLKKMTDSEVATSLAALERVNLFAEYHEAKRAIEGMVLSPIPLPLRSLHPRGHLQLLWVLARRRELEDERRVLVPVLLEGCVPSALDNIQQCSTALWCLASFGLPELRRWGVPRLSNTVDIITAHITRLLTESQSASQCISLLWSCGVLRVTRCADLLCRRIIQNNTISQSSLPPILQILEAVTRLRLPHPELLHSITLRLKRVLLPSLATPSSCERILKAFEYHRFVCQDTFELVLRVMGTSPLVQQLTAKQVVVAIKPAADAIEEGGAGEELRPAISRLLLKAVEVIPGEPTLRCTQQHLDGLERLQKNLAHQMPAEKEALAELRRLVAPRVVHSLATNMVK